jgi:hypothetical protein
MKPLSKASVKIWRDAGKKLCAAYHRLLRAGYYGDGLEAAMVPFEREYDHAIDTITEWQGVRSLARNTNGRMTR